MKKREQPALPRSKRATLGFVKRYGRTRIAVPSLKEIASGIGVRDLAWAQKNLDWLENAGYVEKQYHVPRSLKVLDEVQIPVIKASEWVDPNEPILSEARVVETIRGMLAEQFEPTTDCFVAIKVKGWMQEMLAIRFAAQANEGDWVLGRLQDTIVTGRIEGPEVVVSAPGNGTEAGETRIDRTHPEFRLEGVIVGKICAQAVTEGGSAN